MYSEPSSLRLTQAAIAWAAASFISSLTVRARQRVAQAPAQVSRVRRRRHPRLHDVHPDPAPAVERAVLVHADDLGDPAREQGLHGGRARRADARHDHAEPPELLADDTEGVEERRQHDDRGPVLVVVEDGDVELLAQALLDLEA